MKFNMWLAWASHEIHLDIGTDPGRMARSSASHPCSGATFSNDGYSGFHASLGIAQLTTVASTTKHETDSLFQFSSRMSHECQRSSLYVS